MNKFFVALLLVAISSSAAMADDSKTSLRSRRQCPTFEAAREAYFNGNQAKALSALSCLRKRYPQDLDVRRFLSDIHWWQGKDELSISEAHQIEELGIPENNHELARHIQKRVSHFTLAGGAQRLWGSNNNGNELWTSLAWRYRAHDALTIGFMRAARVFKDASPVSDRIFSVDHFQGLASFGYLETQATFAPNPVFAPRYSVALEPHVVFSNDWDISLGGRYSVYRDAPDAISISAQVLKSFDYFSFKARGTGVVFHESILGSGLLQLKIPVGARFTMGPLAATGKTLEGPDLPSRFHSLGAFVSYDLTKSIVAQIDGSAYRAAVRTEDRAGASLEWSF